VVAREDVQRDLSPPLGTSKRLVAYLVSNRQPTPSVSDLRSLLKEKLPDYMVPSAFVFLETLPLTPSGKVDREALPAPDRSRPDLEKAFVAARTPVERVLTEIWSEVLGLKQVGVNDNFFELGGHSLKATQVISRVIGAFQMEVPLRSIFESPTVADMAIVIVQNQAEAARPENLARMLAELEALSDREAERLLAEENAGDRKF